MCGKEGAGYVKVGAVIEPYIAISEPGIDIKNESSEHTRLQISYRCTELRICLFSRNDNYSVALSCFFYCTLSAHSVNILNFHTVMPGILTTRRVRKVKIQGGSNMTGTDLCVNKPHCAAAVRP